MYVVQIDQPLVPAVVREGDWAGIDRQRNLDTRSLSSPRWDAELHRGVYLGPDGLPVLAQQADPQTVRLERFLIGDLGHHDQSNGLHCRDSRSDKTVPLPPEDVQLAVGAQSGTIGDHEGRDLHVVQCNTSMSGSYGDAAAWEFIDWNDPFEVDEQNAHLAKHPGLCLDDALDVAANDPLFYEACAGPADWLMVAEVPGGDVLVVPLAPSNYSGYMKMRPIGVYPASGELLDAYLRDREDQSDA